MNTKLGKPLVFALPQMDVHSYTVLYGKLYCISTKYKPYPVCFMPGKVLQVTHKKDTYHTHTHSSNFKYTNHTQ